MTTVNQTFKLSLLLFFVSVFLCCGAQDALNDSHKIVIGVPSVAIVDLESNYGSTITLAAVAPQEAGHSLKFNHLSNSGIWLNYSSIKSTSKNPTRDISVAVSNGPLPAGVNLQVVASAYSGNGDGTMGIPAGAVNLSTTPQVLVTDIGSCYTGDGVYNGHNLTYTLSLGTRANSYSALDADESKSISITYTISDH